MNPIDLGSVNVLYFELDIATVLAVVTKGIYTFLEVVGAMGVEREVESFALGEVDVKLEETSTLPPRRPAAPGHQHHPRALS